MTRPYDVNNERQVIAALLKDKDARRKILGLLSADEFQGAAHRAIFKAVKQVGTDEELDTAIILHNDDSGELRRGIVDDLFTKIEAPKNIERHMLRVREHHLRVSNMAGVEALAVTLKNRQAAHADCVGLARDVLRGLTDIGFDPNTGNALCEQYVTTFDERCAGKRPFVSTGYEALDELLTEGFAKKRMTAVCGRTGNGKSMFMTDMVNRLLRHNETLRILVLPLEVGRERFLDMLVSNSTGIAIDMLVRNPEDLTLEQRDLVKRHVKKAVGTDNRLTVLDNPFVKLPRWTNDAAMDKLEELYATGGYDIVMIDLWDRMLVDKSPNEIGRALMHDQDMLQRYELHGIALNQLNRKVEERRDKRPELTDLKGTGAWEEVPDQVLAVHREHKYKPWTTRDDIEVHVLKQRLGDVGTVMEARHGRGCFQLIEPHVQTVRSGRRDKARFSAEEVCDD